jgi:hypothetical protein
VFAIFQQNPNYRNVIVTSCQKTLNCVAQNEREAVHLICLILYHGGALNPYSTGNMPCDVAAVNTRESVEAHFHCWYQRKSDNTGVSFQTECYFVKRVSCSE